MVIRWVRIPSISINKYLYLNLLFINIFIIIYILNFYSLYIPLFFIIFYSFLYLYLSLHFISYYISIDNDDVDDIGGSGIGSINVSNSPISTSFILSYISIFLLSFLFFLLFIFSYLYISNITMAH